MPGVHQHITFDTSETLDKVVEHLVSNDSTFTVNMPALVFIYLKLCVIY